MTKEDFLPKESDLAFIDLYRDFLPKKIYDAHMHFWIGHTLPAFYGQEGPFIYAEAGPEDYLRDMKPMIPGVEEIRLNMFTMLDPAMAKEENGFRKEANEHIYRILEQYPEHTGAPYIFPGDTEEEIERWQTMQESLALRYTDIPPDSGIFPM